MGARKKVGFEKLHNVLNHISDEETKKTSMYYTLIATGESGDCKYCAEARLWNMNANKN